MRKIFTLLFVGLAAFSASAQQVVKTFPSAKQSKSGAPLLAAPAQTPSSMDDKALGKKIFATQLMDESKLRSWLYFYDKNPYNLNRVNIFENEQGWQINGILLGAWGGDNYYCYYGKMNNMDNGMQWRGFKQFTTLDARTGQLGTTLWDMSAEATTAKDGLVVFDYGAGNSEFNNLLDMTYDPKNDLLYTSEAYQQNASSDAVTILYSIDKTTGKLSKVNTIEDQIQYFCFDMDGNMWAISPYWKETGKDEKNNPIFTFSGNYLTKYDENFEAVDGMRFIIKDQNKNNIFATSYGSMGFDHSTGELYFTARVANDATSMPYDKLMKIDTTNGKVVESNTFASGNLIIGMYIPYYTADTREAAARVSDLKATPNANGQMNAVLSWTNPSKAWNGEALTELAGVQIYRKNADYTNCALTSKEIYDNSQLIATVPATAADLGKAMNWTDEAPVDGINTYYVVPCRVDGEKGVPDSIRCAVGLDIPGVPTNFEVAMSGENVAMTWEAPVDGKNNGFINQADLKYDIVRNPGDVTVASDITGTSFTDESVAKVKRGKYTYTIVAKNAKGSSDPVDSKAIEAGLAPMPPVSFAINSEETANQWTALEKNGDGQIFAWAGWKSAYSVYAESSIGEDWAISPAVYLEKGKSYLFTSTFNNNYAGSGHTIGRYVGTAPTIEAMTNMIGEEKEFSTEYSSNPAVVYEDKFTAPESGNYYFGFKVADNTSFDVIDFFGVEIEGIFEHDLKAVELVTYGNDVSSGDVNMCNVTVRNNGAQNAEANSYKIEILQKMEDGDLVVGTVEETPLVRAGSAVDVPAKFIPVEEGDYEFAFRTIYDKDECAINNVSEYKTLKVMPYGESTPWTMVVTDGEEWESSYFPITYTDSDDGSQSIYTKADFAENTTGSNTIDRIGYEYTANSQVTDALEIENVTVWMAATDKNSFSDGVADWTEETQMTEVFSGNVNIYPGKNLLSLQLNTPYEMDPTKNLLICVEHRGAVKKGMGFPCLWRTFNKDGARNRSIRYWAPKASSKFTEKEAAVLFVGFHQEHDGIKDINNGASANVCFDAETGKLILNGSAANVFDLSGKLLRSFNGGKEATLSLPAGMYIIKVRTADGNVQSVKLNINK